MTALSQQPLQHFAAQSEAQTIALAQHLAELVVPGDWLLLRGSLGAGKTTFARALLHALGHDGEVPSPTFTLVQSYDSPPLPFPVWHVDLYRLDGGRDVDQLGLDDAGDDTLLMIEWPERLPQLPGHALLVDFTNIPGRGIGFYGNEHWHKRLTGIRAA